MSCAMSDTQLVLVAAVADFLRRCADGAENFSDGFPTRPIYIDLVDRLSAKEFAVMKS
jgi:hypothetical protein